MVGGVDAKPCATGFTVNTAGPDGLLDNWASGPVPRLSAVQKGELARIFGPALTGNRRGGPMAANDPKRVIPERFDVTIARATGNACSENSAISHISARPRHPAQDAETIELIKKLCPHASARRTASSGNGLTRIATAPACRPALRICLDLVLEPAFDRSFLW